MFCNQYLQELFLPMHNTGGIGCLCFFTLIGQNLKGVLFIGFLYFTNEHYIAIDLNRFQGFEENLEKRLFTL